MAARYGAKPGGDVHIRPDVLALLRCPVCHQGLATAGRSVRCPAGHSFDVARQGYLPLSAGRAIPHGDSAEMIAERVRFLDTGHFAPLTRALIDAVPPEIAGPVLDAGAGTGQHLAAVLAARPGATGLALDASRFALRRAARAHPRAGAVLCDIWGRLPVADACAAAVLDVFAPRNGAEFARVLRPDGVVVVAVPGPDHLAELVGALGLLRVDPAKESRTVNALAPLVPAGSGALAWSMTLTRDEAGALARMGPSARHVSGAALAARIAELPASVRVSARVTVSRYRLPPALG